MNDFFAKLEQQLRAAAEQPPRRFRVAGAVGVGGGAALAAPALALALIVVLAVLGGGDGGGGVTADRAAGGPKPAPVGAVIRKGRGPEMESTVVATGTAPVTGPWQLEVSYTKGLKDPKTGEVLEPPGPCLFMHPLDPPDRMAGGRSGFCGPGNLGFRKTPGFSRAQTTTPREGLRADGTRIRAREVLVFGRTPERAATVVVTAPNGTRIEVEPQEGPRRIRGDFYVIPVEPPLVGARINWLDAESRLGSRGIGLMPPITRR